MKRIILFVLSITLSAGVFAQTKGKTTTTTKTVTKPVVKKPVTLSLLDSASYGIGMAMGSSLKGTGLSSINYDMLLKGLKANFAGTPTMFTQEMAQTVIQNIMNNASKEKFAGNLTEGEAFLKQNLQQSGIQKTASGIQYLVLTQGAGAKPFASDTVQVHYKGTLINGQEFDSSYKRGEPAVFALNQVIRGWTEAVQLMSEGSKYRFYIPYNLAYGERGMGNDIPPYSTLIFDIELLKVIKPK
ncbi:MAG: FKBP-type peptidyl-prolyl cis-trans isomerase [Sphingobacteriales bacterium]|nr:MAG: FKBP-type peptidyl-prolyl cis-trans isomerase [Sphingobacteriales bacterium]